MKRFRYLGPSPERMHIFGAVFNVNGPAVLVKDITGCAILSKHEQFVEVKDAPVAAAPIHAPEVIADDEPNANEHVSDDNHPHPAAISGSGLEGRPRRGRPRRDATAGGN
jgi:hypothetical protein